jgi:ABC-type antimicrobial peptide transport system permease subunit
LLQHALKGRTRSAILGDLDEEFTQFALPERGGRAARRWYWRQTLGSLSACLREPAELDVEPAERIRVRSTLMQTPGGLGADVRSALRSSGRNPLVAGTAVLSLAIGIGASTAVFAVVNAAFLKKLPIANADRLVAISARHGRGFSYPQYLASRDAPGLAAIVAGGRTSATMGEGQARQRVVVQFVTPNFFSALGVGPGTRGRLFGETDGDAGSPPVVVLSERAWRTRFAGDTGVIGSTIRLHRASFTVLGIAPPGFAGAQIGYSPDLWLPMMQAPLIEGNSSMLGPDSAWLGLLGIVDGSQSLESIGAAIEGRWREFGEKENAVIRRIPRGETWYTPAPMQRFRLIVLFAALILVIACLNVVTLLASTVHARQKELAIRASLGAGRPRLLRQLFVEHLTLAVAGGALGAIAGVWASRGLVALMASRFTPGDVDVSPDWHVVLFAVAVTALVAAGCGLLPALRWSRVSTVASLHGTTSGMRQILRSTGVWWLVPWQVAFGTVLLMSGGLLLATVHELKRGIESSAPERVWFADISFADLGDRSPAVEDFYQRLRAHLRTLHGTDVAALSSGRPLASLRRGGIRIEGQAVVPESRPMPWGPPPPPPPRGARSQGAGRTGKQWIVSNSFVTPGYFTAFSLPIVKGRDFTDSDSAGAPRVAIVNETLAARAFGKASPLGRRLAYGGDDSFDVEIVGVVRDLRYEQLRDSAPDGLFLPMSQIPANEAVSPRATGAAVPADVTAVLRVAEGQRLTREQLVQHVLAFDPRLFVDRVQTFDDEANFALSQERLFARLGSTLGAIALGLLVIGLYGTMTAAVVRGTRELGVRLALGASPQALRRMVVGRSLLVVCVGLALGLPLTYVATKSFAHLLFGVRPTDPAVATATVAIVLVTALLAAYVPARRAGRVDPLVALRTDT